MAKEAIQTPN